MPIAEDVLQHEVGNRCLCSNKHGFIRTTGWCKGCGCVQLFQSAAHGKLQEGEGGAAAMKELGTGFTCITPSPTVEPSAQAQAGEASFNTEEHSSLEESSFVPFYRLPSSLACVQVHEHR
jgi:hypothetical protein